jgi:cyclophilin family peptidyl-prolyl cis-trans isomerase
MNHIGRYEVRGEIGRGGFGVVYAAHDPAMHRDVAIKVLTVATDHALLARFQAEAGTTGNLRHKNIITVYDYGEHEGQPYLVMELLDGRSLLEILRNAAPVALSAKVDILVQVAEGLRYAHEHGVVHRDIKPSNIMLLQDGTAKILDFGIARFADRSGTQLTATGFIVGTLEYMAPDQFDGGQADCLTDIFSFGVVGYELISGRQPFRGETISRTIYLLSKIDPAPLGDIVPGCPEALQDVFQTAISKDRTRRYQNVRELLFELMPLHARLRKERAAELVAEAGRLLEDGEIEAAQTHVHQALEFDPTLEPAQNLRHELQRRREKDALVRRREALIGSGEEHLSQGAFEAAIEAFEVALTTLTPHTAQLRLHLEGRISEAKRQKEAVERFKGAMAKVRAAIASGDLLTASRCLALAREVFPGSHEVADLSNWIAAQIEEQRLAAERAERERLLREEMISAVIRAVDDHLRAGRFQEAEAVVQTALNQFPGDPILANARPAIANARRSYASQLELARQRAREEQRRAEEQLKLLEARAADGLPTAATIGPVTPVPEAPPDPPATPAPSLAETQAGRTWFEPPTLFAASSGPGSRRNWLLICAGVAVVICGLGLGLVWLTTAGKSHQPAAETTRPVDPGRQNPRTDALASAIKTAISSRQWLQAQASIDELGRLAPADPRLADLRKQAAAGLRLDGETNLLRNSIVQALRDKQWTKAQASIALLLDIDPRNSEVSEWRNAISVGRKNDLTTKKDDNGIGEIDQLRSGVAGRPPGLYWIINTSMGTITAQLYEKEAPGTVANFVALTKGTKAARDKSGAMVKRPYFTNLIFHRVIPGFLIQTGDGQGGDGAGDCGFTIKDEFVPTLRYDKGGVLGLARLNARNTGACQFFITDAASPSLNGDYTIFGQVMEGQDVVAKIARVPKDSNDKPRIPVTLISATIKRYGPTEAPSKKAATPPPKEDNERAAQIDMLRSLIALNLRNNAWDQAEQRIGELLTLAPGYPQAEAWKKQVAAGRVDQLRSAIATVVGTNESTIDYPPPSYSAAPSADLRANPAAEEVSKAGKADGRTWRVIAFTYRSRDAAIMKAEQVNRQHQSFHATVFSPKDKQDYFLICLGGHMTYEDAVRLQKKARTAGMGLAVCAQYPLD